MSGVKLNPSLSSSFVALPPVFEGHERAQLVMHRVTGQPTCVGERLVLAPYIGVYIRLYSQRYSHHEPHTAQSWFEWRELRRQEAGFDDEGGGRLSVDGRGREGLNSP